MRYKILFKRNDNDNAKFHSMRRLHKVKYNEWYGDNSIYPTTYFRTLIETRASLKLINTNTKWAETYIFKIEREI